MTCPPEHVTWTGTNKCHCSLCHETFSNVETFDSHRVKEHCVSPNLLPLTYNKHGVWVGENEIDYDERFGRT